MIDSLAGMINTVRNSVDLAHTITDDSENFPPDQETDYFYSHRHRGDIVNSWTYLITIPHEHPIAPYTQPQAWAAAQADRSRGIANELAYLSIPQFQSTLDTWKDLAKALWLTPSTITPTAGTPFNLTVAARDSRGNLLTGYTGTVHFSSSDGQAGLPADYRFTTGPGGDNGVHTFQVTVRTAGAETVTATDTATSTPLNGDTAAVTVSPAAASRFAVSAPASIQAGQSFSLPVTAYDPYGNIATNYTGTVRFDSSDSQAVLPHDSSLTNGGGTFSVTLKTTGSQSVTVTDTTGSPQGGATVTITPAAASRLGLSAPANAVAGVPFTVTLTAYDPYNNIATGYHGLVHFISSDPQPVLPPDYRFTTGPGGDNGVYSFTVILNTAGDQNVIVFDLTNINLLTGAMVTVTSEGGAGGSGSGSRPPVAVTEADGPSWTERSVSPVDRATVERFFAAAAQVNPENVFARSKPHPLGLAEDVWWDLALSPDVI